MTVSGQQYTVHGERRTLSDKYVPRHVFEKYTALNDAFADEHPGNEFGMRAEPWHWQYRPPRRP